MTAIRHLSDTARVVAYFRALEHDRVDALFRDPFARRLAGAAGEDMAQQLDNRELFARAMAVRTVVFDQFILEAITSRSVDFVLNLAAGMDSRPWRLPLPATLHWIDVDLPVTLEHKASVLLGQSPRCEYLGVPTDLTDEEARAQLFRRFGALGACGLVVTEGLLVYLPPNDVAALARGLAMKELNYHYWLTDVLSPRPLEVLRRIWQPVLAGSGIKFQFATPDSVQFFGALGWQEVAYRSALEESTRLGRFQLPWLTRLALWLGTPSRREGFRRVAGSCLMQRA
jgi:methyltransferase (TIGR00027 family)